MNKKPVISWTKKIVQFPNIMVFFVLLGFFVSFPAVAAEYSDGKVRLVLDEQSGRFSMYLLSENDQAKPLPLFSSQDPRTSFLSILVNDRSYKMGESSAFGIRLLGDGQNPYFVFESSFMSVTEEFSFVRGTDSNDTNGVSVKITLENRGERAISAGARFLLDTNLSEKTSGVPFTTDLRTISSETLITRTDSDKWWNNRNDTVSLTGSLNTGSPLDPDSVHFANWKRLSDISWKAQYQPGRNFSFPPYSLGDTAVCYYYEPLPLNGGEKRSFGFYLLINSNSGSDLSQTSGGVTVLPAKDATANSREQDLVSLREIMSRIDAGIAAGTLSDEELAALENDLGKLQAKYNSGANSESNSGSNSR